jgi:hypothetical protein
LTIFAFPAGHRSKQWPLSMWEMPARIPGIQMAHDAFGMTKIFYEIYFSQNSTRNLL